MTYKVERISKDLQKTIDTRVTEGYKILQVLPVEGHVSEFTVVFYKE